jgi:hypothetical protein
MDRFSKACLLLVFALVAMVTLRLTLPPQPAEAAHHYKYKAVLGGSETNRPSLQNTLDDNAAQGWDLVAALTGPSPNQPLLIFRK